MQQHGQDTTQWTLSKPSYIVSHPLKLLIGICRKENSQPSQLITGHIAHANACTTLGPTLYKTN